MCMVHAKCVHHEIWLKDLSITEYILRECWFIAVSPLECMLGNRHKPSYYMHYKYWVSIMSLPQNIPHEFWVIGLSLSL